MLVVTLTKSVHRQRDKLSLLVINQITFRLNPEKSVQNAEQETMPYSPQKNDNSKSILWFCLNHSRCYTFLWAWLWQTAASPSCASLHRRLLSLDIGPDVQCKVCSYCLCLLFTQTHTSVPNEYCSPGDLVTNSVPSAGKQKQVLSKYPSSSINPTSEFLFDASS